MKKIIPLVAIGFTLIFQASVNAQGTLTPTSAPAPTQKSLQEIWDKLDVISQSIPELVQQAIAPVEGMIPVLGGKLPQGSSFSGQRVASFYIGKYEVKYGDWKTVRSWAVSNGYDLSGIGTAFADGYPVRAINWYDAVKWCNAKSQMEGLSPVYTVNGTVFKSGSLGSNGSSAITQNLNATGYRLPIEAEWEWAARGGVVSKGYVYSGGNDPDLIGWYWNNASGSQENLIEGRGSWPVGSKAANELGIYDMMGNVVEWCWDVENSGRRLRGGSFDSSASTLSATGHYGAPDSTYFNQGLRIVKKVGQ